MPLRHGRGVSGARVMVLVVRGRETKEEEGGDPAAGKVCREDQAAMAAVSPDREGEDRAQLGLGDLEEKTTWNIFVVTDMWVPWAGPTGHCIIDNGQI